jgi:hypothetical protein
VRALRETKLIRLMMPVTSYATFSPEHRICWTSMMRRAVGMDLRPNEMYGSNAPHPKEAPPSSLQPEIGQMTYGTLLESPGESRLWYAIRGPKGAVRWGRFHLSCCATASATGTESSTTASGPSRLIATGLDALSSFTASAIRPGYRGLPHARRPCERLIARGRRAPTNDCIALRPKLAGLGPSNLAVAAVLHSLEYGS